MSRTTNRRTAFRAGALVAAGLLVAGLGAPAAADKPVDAGPADSDPMANTMVISVASGLDVPGTPGGVGLVYVTDDDAFDVTVEFFYDADPGDQSPGVPAPITTSRDVAISLTGSSDAFVQPPDVVATSGATHVLFDEVSSGAAINMVLTASADLRGRHSVPDADFTLDVLDVSMGISTTGRTSIGGSPGDEGCDATPEQPLCADLLPPTRAPFVDGGLLSATLCTAADCDLSYIQALVAFVAGSESAPGDPNDPATLIVKCDKTRCGGGAIHRQELQVQLRPGDPIDVAAPACTSKGVVDGGLDFCVDYVQSTRDNSGDTHLYLLFVLDARVRWM